MLKGRLKDQSIFLSGSDINQILSLAKQSYENYLIRASEKDLDNAIDYYLEAIDIDPSISEAYYRLATLLWERGQIDINSALEKCETAIKLSPDSAIARLYLGYFLKAAGRFEDAEKEFKTSIKLSGLFSAKPRIALGTTIIQKMRVSSPSFSELMRGLHYFFSGMVMLFWDYGALRMLYKTIISDITFITYKFKGALWKKLRNYKEAVKTYENAAEKTGKKDMFYSQIGDLALEVGNPYQAIEYYKNALKESPENVVLWAKLANTLQTYYKDDVDELADCYSHLAELEPNNARIYYELGHLYIKLEDKLCAVSTFKKACELEPENPFYHNSLAYALVQMEDYEGAISEYQKAIKLNPDNEWTSVVSQALGAIYHQVKDNKEAAIVAYQTAILLDPKNVDACIALGELYHESGDLSRAIDCYLDAIKLDQSIAKVYCNLGLALWEKDYVEESIIAYQKAVSINTKYEIAFNNLGVVYLDGAGKVEEALAMFSQAIKHNPNYALAYYNRGRAYQAFGDNLKAAENYQMAIDINRLTNEIDEEEVYRRIHRLFTVD